MSRIEEDDVRGPGDEGGWDPEEDDLERATENVLDSWPTTRADRSATAPMATGSSPRRSIG